MPTTASQRARILSRDLHACQCRGQYGCDHHDAGTRCLAGLSFFLFRVPYVSLEVDHIIAEADGGSDDDSNLQTLCNQCHEAKTSQGTSRRHTAALLRNIFSARGR